MYFPAVAVRWILSTPGVVAILLLMKLVTFSPVPAMTTAASSCCPATG